MNEIIEFSTREEFREWLVENCLSKSGVWLLFGKAGRAENDQGGRSAGGSPLLWLDRRANGSALTRKLTESILLCAEKTANGRRKTKPWLKSWNNKGLYATDYGRARIRRSQEKTASRNAPKIRRLTEDMIDSLAALLKQYDPAYTNFLSMSLSVKKTYTRAYFDAKTDAGREKRLAWMVDRLNENLKPM